MFRPHTLLGLLVALLSTTAAIATPVVTVSPVTFNPDGTTGFFDLGLTNSGSEQIAAYTATFTITGRTGATGGFTFAGDYATMAPSPLFPGQNPFEVTSPANQNPVHSSSGSIIGATDSDNSGFVTGGNNTNLFRANFSIDPGTTGTFDITLNLSSTLKTQLTDNGHNPIAVNTVNGAVTAPEPTSLGLAALAGLALLRRRSRITRVAMAHDRPLHLSPSTGTQA